MWALLFIKILLFHLIGLYKDITQEIILMSYDFKLFLQLLTLFWSYL